MLKRKETLQQPSSARMWISDEETQPLPEATGLVFRAFLARYELSMLDVALAAGVRLLTIWNMGRDNPISHQQAERVCEALYRLTGVHYRGWIILRLDCAFGNQTREA